MNNTLFSALVRSLAVATALVTAAGCNATKNPPADAGKSDPKTDSAASKPADRAAAPSSPVALEGKYSVSGSNPAGTPYSGDLEIIKHDQVYQFRWNAGRQYDGVGVQQDGVVAVSFCEGEDGKGCGVVCYRIGSDGSLDGKWGMWGTDDGGSEKATRTGGGGQLEGEYAMTGKNPSGTDYKGTLTITAADGGYNLAWSNGSTGFGIKRGDHLTVGYGGSKCGFVSYAVKPDGTLEGIWGGPGLGGKSGTETAKRK